MISVMVVSENCAQLIVLQPAVACRMPIVDVRHAAWTVTQASNLMKARTHRGHIACCARAVQKVCAGTNPS
eukprot:CAMPEP_0174379322 /NCGR_PEP_ID=MMETSP0811_2-20130205/122630_1 /TAXON_ID=73025 ORGANISM="Eutreptiella gymnastica-like, Strain CCMP1594" /NCGR_SAMPLE_ID=MMETSP0811_2 /ASSEMBLY_ACC=CAM_ASM_000667 /LENGTH=70 /DNA_ID=CAMNT_0015531825 /DNA_START=713 /DNA_END=925 /DNA_ORIENTATION=-